MINLNNLLNASMGLESLDQDIEIEAEEVIINNDATIDGEMAEAEESSEVIAEAEANIEKAERAEATLESLIAQLSYQLDKGGMTRDVAAMANVSLESVAMTFGFPTKVLNVGMEDIDEDSEETTRTLKDRAKDMLGKIRENTSLLVQKILLESSALLGNLSAIATKLIAKANAVKARANDATYKTEPLKMGLDVTRYLSVDATAADPARYIGDLQKTFKVINSMVDTYGGADGIKAIMALPEDAQTESKSKTSIKQAVAFNQKLKKLIPHKVTADQTNFIESDETDNFGVSDKLLGGIQLQYAEINEQEVQKFLQLFAKAVEEIKSKYEAGETVSAESFALSMEELSDKEGSQPSTNGKIAGLVFIWLGVFNMGMGFAALPMIPLAAVPAIIMGVAMFALGKQIRRESSGTPSNTGEKVSTELFGSKAIKNLNAATLLEGIDAKTICAATTDFILEQNKTAMYKDVTTQPLDARQVQQVCDIVADEAQTIKAYADTIKDRKNAANQLAKSIEKLNNVSKDKETKQAIRAVNAFVTHRIKSLVKLEIDMMKQMTKVCKAALVYCESSMGKPAEAAKEDEINV